MNLNKYTVSGKDNIRLSKTPTKPGKEYSEESLAEKLETSLETISDLQYKLFAENRRSLLIILQGMDSSGKDGTIKHLARGINPQGLRIWSFKHPSDLELEHDFLWRHIQKLPEHGEITIFNRSHYENVLISKVHPELVLAERKPGIDAIEKVNKKFWKERYTQINEFEDNLRKNGIEIIKCFLHISYEEQRQRFLKRLEDKEKHWKFSSADITERGFWKEYQKAYEDALEHTGTKAAPWHIIPADSKPFAHMLIARIIKEKLEDMAPEYPPIDKKEEKLMRTAHRQLLQGL